MSSLTIPTIYTAVDKFTAPMRRIIASTDVFAARAERGLRSVKTFSDGMFDKLTGGHGTAALGIGFGLASAAMVSFVKNASLVENAVAQFTPILGGVDKATAFVKDLNKEAASTPFEFNQVKDAVGSLLPALQGNTQKAIRLWRMMGDASGGNAERMASAVYGLNKALLKGKVDMESLNIISEAGVPIHNALAKQMGFGEKQMAQYFKAISAGKVGTDSLVKALEAMTGKGGMFFNGMNIASQTLSGKLSSLKDNLNLAAGAIGMAMLPVMKEYTDKAMATAGKIMEWAQANQELIKTKIESFISKLATAAKFLYDNFDTIVTITKWYVGTLIALKVVSMASAIATGVLSIATGAYNIVLGINTVLTKGNLFALRGNTVALAAYGVATKVVTAFQWLWNGALKAVTAAQWLWNAAMTANPIGLIIVGIAALIGLIVAVIVKWNEWGAAVSLFLGPIGMVISIIQSFRRNWDMVVEAFSKGGILSGIKAIGKVLLDAVLMPVQQLVGIIGKLTGWKWAEEAVAGIEKFRKELGVNVTTDESGRSLAAKAVGNTEKAVAKTDVVSTLSGSTEAYMKALGLNASPGETEASAHARIAEEVVNPKVQQQKMYRETVDAKQYNSTVKFENVPDYVRVQSNDPGASIMPKISSTSKWWQPPQD